MSNNKLAWILAFALCLIIIAVVAMVLVAIGIWLIDALGFLSIKVLDNPF